MDNTKQTQITLGKAALDYLVFCLAMGQTLLAAQQELPLTQGRLWAYLPASLRSGSDLNPVWSLTTPLPFYHYNDDAGMRFAKFILSFLHSGHGRYALFQD